MKLPYRWKQKWVQLLQKWRVFKKDLNLNFRYLQDDIYEIDKVAHPYLRAFTVLLSVLVIASVLIPIGFELTPELVHLNRQIEGWILFGFVANFLLRLALTNDHRNYLKKRWFEGIVSIFSIILLIDIWVSSIGVIAFLSGDAPNPERIFLQFLKGYLLFIVVIKFLQYLPELLDQQKNTARFLVYSFLSLIASGTFLLMLPGATQDSQGLMFINALFTSTSAVCVTGLIVVDTATHFTLFGELVILTLIQLGGIGIVTFATFLFLFISGGLGVGQMNTLKGMVGESNTSLVTSTLKQVVGFTFAVELIGAIGYYISWEVSFPSHGQRILFSIFHAISAFCNAGFSLFTNSLADGANATNLGINITTIILIVLGGLGFTTIWEMIRTKTDRSRWRRRLSIHTRTVLVTTAVLIVIGTAFILAMEWDQTLAGYSWGNKVLVSLFQSVTTRTAGFNTINTGAIGISATLVMLILMFIGGSPASTAGGIKTTTFAVLMRSLVMTIRGYDRMELFKRTVPNRVIFRAMTVILLAASCIGMSTILLSIVEDHAFMDLLFEEISAFATVGLSRGITSDLTPWGKVIIVVSMFLGRVGILTFMVAFASRIDTHDYEYPEETIMVS
ncbi:TrkH family potassium uptake protein [Fodinibius sediminis]|uniref:Potassium uptake protein, TrkH family n=1 Tax=Fodinibius sediminis TaxID=1214077 RepID=A0A521DBP8_9BACT|nr:potassium transporter TrkG [Fodinibius sediminis]SMO69035.1 potassium uptake protein, TrkH family [Fodinibius sediminis]